MQCIIGERGTEQDYKKLARNPLDMCMFWRRENSKSIVFTDLDSFNGDDNSGNLTAMLEVVKNVDIPVSVFSDFKDTAVCRMLLAGGIHRVIIQDLALIDPDGVVKLIEDFTASRVAFNMFARDRKTEFTGFGSGMTDVDFALYVKGFGANRLIYSDYSWLNYSREFDPDTLRDLIDKSGMRITLAGGVSNYGQLMKLSELEKIGVDSLIMSKPLYNNNFPCQKIWRLAEAETEFGE